MNGTIRFTSITSRNVSADTLTIGSLPSEHPAQLISRSNLFKGEFCNVSKCAFNVNVTDDSFVISAFRNVSYGNTEGGLPSTSVIDDGGGRLPMMIMCHDDVDDEAFSACEIAYPIVPDAPVRRHTFVVVADDGIII